MEVISNFFNSQTGSLVYLTLLAAVADFVIGVWAAFKSGTFKLDQVAAFLRSQVLGKITPIFFLLLLGYLVGLVPTPAGLAQFAPAAFTLAGTAGALLYIAETFGSIMSSLRQSSTNAKDVPNE